AKGTHQGFACWRWSSSSLNEAATLAQEAARRIAERFHARENLQRGYGYPDRPVREPVLREIRAPDGELAGAITRNSYGALVLNTARVMFADVDLPEPRSSGGGWLKKLFGKPEPSAACAAEESALARAEAWRRGHSGWGWRVYRTKAGLRLVATHALFDADGASTEQVFEALGADPLYRRLCRTQKCFRARLTPKPWRCGIQKPPSRWPWPDAKTEARFKEWETRYLRACRDYATCEAIPWPGDPQVDPTVQLILGIHDKITLAGSRLDLA
ncbi:MAG: hypothetical protein KA118_13485, partial [Verrucomicrobia bacterium]|nr:hypothetical protein [Verrucomicrobiota bacterium]